MSNGSSRLPAQARQWVEMTLGPDARIVSPRRLHGGLSSVAHALAIGRNTETFGAVLKRPEVWVEDIVECFNRIGSQLTEPAAPKR